ncbi:MAG: spermidine/putrescine transport system ATP-binding protein [Frankiales bacterium]|jgi:spermidine/putrescine transport system ATP-binding protein|nr:spermidine/putrescine transport system ATP-binding protein [Frankiales bacterium]
MTDSTDSDQASQDLRIVDLTKRFGTATAVDDISLTVPAGSFFALLGPSGCGKTTTLRMVAGLEDPTSGAIFLGNDDVTYRKPYKRPVNTVFQNYALFPHLDVFDNVAFGLRRRGIKGVDKQVNEMLELVELAGYGGRKPAQLSGGQQQRVALARALINRPQVLLLDEPLGALDLKLRRQMQLELKRIQTEVGITFVHVTHDQEEAMTMADTIAVMNEGKVEQLGAPEDLYENPCTVFVANFLGQSNLLTASVTGQSGDDLLLDVAGIKLTMPATRRGTGSDRLYVGIRPEKIRLRHSDDPADAAVRNEVSGVITDSSFTGVSTQYLVRTGWGQELMVYAPNLEYDGRLRPGAPVVLSWNPAHSFGLEATGNAKAGMDEGVLEVASAAAGS